jgi:DNA-binding GntR family transcriptional regulator
MSTVDADDRLARDRYLLERSGTAERVAAILRQHITEGVFPPVAHERLAVHELNRGVFVRELTARDIADLYLMRRVTECGALRRAAELSTVDLSGVGRAVREGRAAAEEEDWQAVGTASIAFHQALGDLAGSERVSTTMRQVLAETRLFFVLTENTRAFFEPFLDRHERILRDLEHGRFGAAETALERYLREAEKQLLAAYERRG